MSIRNEIAELVDAAARRAQAAGDLPSVALADPAVERPANADHGDYASSLPLRLARAARMSPHADRCRHREAAAVARLHRRGEGAAARLHQLPPRRRLAGPAGRRDHRTRARASPQSDLGAGQQGAGRVRQRQPHGAAARRQRPLGVDRRLAGARAGGCRLRGREGVPGQRRADPGRHLRPHRVRALPAALRPRRARCRTTATPASTSSSWRSRSRTKSGDKYLNDAEPSPELRRPRRRADDRPHPRRPRGDERALRQLVLRVDPLQDGGAYKDAMQLLRDKGAMVEKDGAVWLNSTALGEEKDNVLVRSTGVPDLLRLRHRLPLRQVLPARLRPRHRHLGRRPPGPRLAREDGRRGAGRRRGRPRRSSSASSSACGAATKWCASRSAPARSSRLREVVDEVGADACRFFFLQRSADAQMEFDLDLAKRQTNENPVYYVQYAHARIAGILTQAAERGIDHRRPATSRCSATRPSWRWCARCCCCPSWWSRSPRAWSRTTCRTTPRSWPTAFHDFYEKCRVLPRRDGASAGGRRRRERDRAKPACASQRPPRSCWRARCSSWA